MTFVMPELISDQPFLRSRACWVYGEFGDYSFSDDKHIQQATDGVYQNLSNEHLPVRLSAALALSKLIQNETAANFMKPALSSILQVYLKIMNEIDSEELIEAFEQIVNIFKDQLAPYALEICTQLVEQYKRLI